MKTAKLILTLFLPALVGCTSVKNDPVHPDILMPPSGCFNEIPQNIKKKLGGRNVQHFLSECDGWISEDGNKFAFGLEYYSTRYLTSDVRDGRYEYVEGNAFYPVFDKHLKRIGDVNSRISKIETDHFSLDLEHDGRFGKLARDGCAKFSRQFQVLGDYVPVQVSPSLPHIREKCPDHAYFSLLPVGVEKRKAPIRRNGYFWWMGSNGDKLFIAYIEDVGADKLSLEVINKSNHAVLETYHIPNRIQGRALSSVLDFHPGRKELLAIGGFRKRLKRYKIVSGKWEDLDAAFSGRPEIRFARFSREP